MINKILSEIYFFLYQLLTWIILPVFLTAVFFHALFRKQQRGPYLQRLGIKLPFLGKKTDGETRLWIHSVSVGEVNVAVQVIRILLETKPDLVIGLSCTTPTGFEMARKNLNTDKVIIFYYPIDFTWSIKRCLKSFEPDVIAVVETEIWPNFAIQTYRKKIPFVIINGRLGQKEFRNYRIFRFFFRHILNLYASISMQGKDDADRIIRLGAAKSRVFYNGNIKFDVKIPDLSKRDKLKHLFPENVKLRVIFASTHKNEENLIIEHWKKLKQEFPLCDLVLAPRHPIRAKEVCKILNMNNLNYILRSLQTDNDIRKADDILIDDILIIDTIGELMTIFSFCDIVVMGGSFSKAVGGHNIIEPALFGCAIISGPYMYNFKEIIEVFRNDNAVIECSPDNLIPAIRKIIVDENMRRNYQEAARQVIKKNQGAGKRNSDLIISLLP